MLRKVVVQRKGPTVFTKHSHLFQFVGALLVFLTFICHEVLHDRWKDLADAIDATRSTMLIRKDIEQTNIGIREIRQISFELWDEELSQGSDALLRRDKHRKLDKLIQAAESKTSGADDKLFWELLGDLNQSNQIMRNASDLVPLISDRTQKAVQQQLKDDLHKYEDQCLDVDDSSFETRDHCIREKVRLEFAISKFMNSVLDVAREERETYSRRATLFGWISIGTYSLGWALGLVGTIYGVKVAMCEE